MTDNKELKSTRSITAEVWSRMRKYGPVVWDWFKFLLLLVVLIFATVAIFANAAEWHWGLAILLAVVYGYGAWLGWQDLRGDRLRPRQGVGSIILMTVVFMAIFATVSHALRELGIANYEGEVLQAGSKRDQFIWFVIFYGWLFFDLIPVLEITKTLCLKPPFQPEGLVAGLPIVGFRGLIVLLFLKEIKAWWQRTTGRTGSLPEESPTRPPPTTAEQASGSHQPPA